MPEIKRVFLRGKMNKDLDERLLPDGEYRDASNIQISSTESSDAGTVQNILGNRYTHLDTTVNPAIYVKSLNLGGSCISIVENTETEKIYLFIKGTSVDAIVEYSEAENTYKPILIENKSRSNPVLNFTDEKLTGVIILEDFLIFTDNNSEPKIIDISDDSIFVAGSVDYTTTTQIDGQNFVESDVTLIRKSPLNAPGVKFELGWGTLPGIIQTWKAIHRERFVRFAYRWKFTNGQYSTYSPFTDPIFVPSSTQVYDTAEGFNEAMFNNIRSASLVNIEHGKSKSGDEEDVNNIKSVDILYKESGNSNVYLYKTIKHEDIVDKWETGVDVSKESKKNVIPDDQLYRAYDNVPYKAKAVDIVGNRIVFGNYEDGLNLDDYNPEFEITLKDRGDLNTETTRYYLNEVGDGTISATAETGVKDIATVKSGREYQVGVVFQDEYGRKSPVLTNETGYKQIKYHTGFFAAGADDPDYGKKFNIKNTNAKPTDPRIKKFRYYIKSSINKYNNIIVEETKLDKEDPDTLWLIVSSYEINKTEEGKYLLFKKGKNSQTPLNSATILNPTNTVYEEDDFKVKILSIVDEKPENIDTELNYDGKFFIKIKRNGKVITNLHNLMGLAGYDGAIPKDEFRELDTEYVIGGLFLGQVDVTAGTGFSTMRKYYYKDGGIVWKTGMPLNPTYITTTPNTFENSNFSPSGVVGAYQDLANVVNAATTDAEGLASANYTDSAGKLVSKIEVKYGADTYPTDFKITYVGGSGSAEPATPAIFETIPEGDVLDVYYETTKAYDISEWDKELGFDLSFYNAFTMRNGVESNLICDDYNQDSVGNGIKVSTIINKEYSERVKESSLIYSGIFNDETDVNKLNEFNTGLKITKELNPEYGSIQKLHTRNTDLIAFCEDKVLRILANKDALYNADGNINLTASTNVLGQAVGYNGDFGISKNPESFANYGYRSYFTDKARGAVLRLSKDGLTVISDKGMSSFFRENLLNENNDIIGSYDIYSDQYILSLPTYGSSISFKEDVDGWVSRLSFIPDGGVSLNGNYYTCYESELYLHHADGGKRNQFYGNNVTSGIRLIFNQESSTIKNFKNIIYEGTTGWEIDTEGIKTDQQYGEVIEFKKKEGKYFGLISGINNNVDIIKGDELDSRLKDFSIQGLGNISSHSGTETFVCANAGLTINSGEVGEIITGEVTSGTITNIVNRLDPPTNVYLTGTNTYDATIIIPSGYDNTGGTISCPASAGAVDTSFSCNNAGLNIADGTVGTTVSGTTTLGTIASYSPTTYSADTSTEYKATINIPSGYSNSGTIECEDTDVTVTPASCGFSLVTNGTYANGGTTITGTFSGTDYTGSDTIALTVGSGTISPTTTTKTALANGLAVTLSEGVTITATVTSGLCSTSTTVQAPQSVTVVINGLGTSFTYNNIALIASTTGTVTSYQWYKSTSSSFTAGDTAPNDNDILGETSATLTTQEGTEDTIYYKVKINGTTDSVVHPVVYSNRPSFTLKFIAGSSITQGACSSSTTKTIYANNSSFTDATEFYTNIQGSTTGFEEGTYSNSTNGTNNHHRFISSSGVPQAALVCSTGSQGIKASKCNNADYDKHFNVNLGSGSTLTNGDVISFTSTVESNAYWQVEDASYGGSSFDHSVTLLSTHNSCTLMLTPVIDVTSPVSSSFIYDAGSLITRTLSAATRSNQPQGITPSFQWQGGTTNNNLSDISGATGETLDVNFNTVSNSAGQPTYYNCNVTYQDGGDTKTVADTTNASIVWNNFTTYTNLNYVNGGSASAPSITACTDTSSQITLYGNNANLASVTQFYRNSNGSASPAVTVGTYSDGTKRAYVLGGGAVASAWESCNNFTISGSATGSSYATVLLTANQTGFNGTNFVWTAGGTQVQSGSDNTFSATVANTFSGNVTYTCTVSGGDTPSGITNPAQHTIAWSVPSQKVQAKLCPNGSNLDILLTNAEGYSVGDVISLTGSGLTSGCYEITGSFSGTQQYSALVSGTYPFPPSSSCCDCSNCSASISRSGDATIVVNTNVTFTASASGYTATNYAWYVKNSLSESYPTTPIQTGSSNQLQNQTSGSAGSKYYKAVVTATGVSREAEITQSWYATEEERWYVAENLQSDCSTAADEVITVRYTSFLALSNGTVFEKTSGVTVTCYTITGSGNGNNTVHEIGANDFHASCIACQNANSVDCSFSLSSSGNYNSLNGTDTITGTFGSGHTGTVSVGFSVSSGTVSPGSATKAQLESGVTLTLSPNVTLTGTINSSDACAGDSATVTIPQSTCNSVMAYSTTSNPAVSGSGGANDLCNPSGSAKALYINGTTLSNSTQVYQANGCGSLISGTKYYSTDNSNYYIWNGSSLSGPYYLNCP